MERLDPDWETWHSAQAGSETAYLRLRKEYAPLIRNQLHHQSSQAAEFDLDEIEQDVWIAVWRALPTFAGRATFKTWLASLARNVLLSWLRQQRRRERTLTGFKRMNGSEANESPVQLDAPARLSITEALLMLPPREQEVIQLRYFERLGDAEISLRLGSPLGTVKGRIRSGLTHLRQQLNPSSETVTSN